MNVARAGAPWNLAKKTINVFLLTITPLFELSPVP